MKLICVLCRAVAVVGLYAATLPLVDRAGLADIFSSPTAKACGEQCAGGYCWPGNGSGACLDGGWGCTDGRPTKSCPKTA
jgi:hypothetical protein